MTRAHWSLSTLDRHLFEDVLRDKTLEWLEDRDDSKPFLAVISTHATWASHSGPAPRQPLPGRRSAEAPFLQRDAGLRQE